jgi:hypothetical protein
MNAINTEIVTTETDADVNASTITTAQAPTEPTTGQEVGTVEGQAAQDQGIETEAESIEPHAFVDAPANILRAALACASKDETRYYLQGIYLHAVDGLLRMVATDGHRLFVASHQPATALPSWLESGIILSSEYLIPKLTIATKISDNPLVRIGYGRGQARAMLTDMGEEMTFRHDVVDATFPNYQTIVAGLTGGVDADREGLRADFQPVTFNGKYLKAVGDVAAVLGGKDASVSVFAAGPNDPTIMTFPATPGTMLVLMPMAANPMASAATVALVAPAIKGSLAALRAHQTRNQEAADNATDAAEKALYQAKADEFKRRAEDLLKRTLEQPALPAPEPAAEAASEGVGELVDGQPLGVDVDAAAEPTGEAETETTAANADTTKATTEAPSEPTVETTEATGDIAGQANDTTAEIPADTTQDTAPVERKQNRRERRNQSRKAA